MVKYLCTLGLRTRAHLLRVWHDQPLEALHSSIFEALEHSCTRAPTPPRLMRCASDPRPSNYNFLRRIWHSLFSMKYE